MTDVSVGRSCANRRLTRIPQCRNTHRSFWQARLAQAFHVISLDPASTKWPKILSVDNSRFGVDLAKPVDGFVRLFHPPSHGATGGKCADRSHAARGRTHRPFSPRARFGMSPTKEMRQRTLGRRPRAADRPDRRRTSLPLRRVGRSPAWRPGRYLNRRSLYETTRPVRPQLRFRLGYRTAVPPFRRRCGCGPPRPGHRVRGSDPKIR